ncbi:MAG TPA: hypothetical protein VFH36_16880 [Acidimicrobiales bacterium]|nr:hypothetical protein [Acidimicrobiales bacterium]
MTRLRSPRPDVSGLLVVLVLAGLLVMHGIDATALAHGPRGDATLSPTERRVMEQPGPDAGERAIAVPGSVASGEMASPPDASHTGVAGAGDRAGHVGWGHMAAVCLAVLATVATSTVRRLVAGARARTATGGGPVAGRLVRLPRVFRPPGVLRVELCVLTC